MLNYRNEYSNFTKFNFAPFKNHKRDTYAVLTTFFKEEITITNILDKIVEGFIYLEDFVTLHQEFRFNKENEFSITFLEDVLKDEFLLSDQKLKVNPESCILLRSALDTFYIVRTRNESYSNSNEFSRLLLEKFDTFQREIQKQITDIHLKINFDSGTTATFKPTNETPSNFTEAETIINNIYNKLARYHNHIKNYDTHLENNTTPRSLFYNRFPKPFIQDDADFVKEYNKYISEFQTKAILLSKETLEKRIDSLERELVEFKTKFSSEKDIDLKFKTIEKKVFKSLEPQFKIKNEQTLRAMAKPYISIKQNTNDNNVNSNQGQPNNTNNRRFNNRKYNSQNRSNQNFRRRQNYRKRS